MKKYIWVVGFGACLVSFVLTCASVQSRFNDARNKDTVHAYEDFLKNYPDSPFATQAHQRLMELSYLEAKRRDDVIHYEDFLKKYPDSPFATEAHERLMELSYLEAKRQDDVIYYEDFLKKNPDSPFASEVRQRLMELSYEEARNKDTILGYEELLTKYPDHPRSAWVKNRIEVIPLEVKAEQEFPSIDTTNIDELEAFIRKYPTGPASENAREHVRQLIEAKAEEEFAAVDKTNILDLEAFVRKYPTGHASLTARQQIEDLIIEEIKNGGVGDRFKISEIGPHEGGGVGSCTMTGSLPDYWTIEAEYPKDRLPISMGRVSLPRGSGSVLRFKGEISFEGYTFNGEFTYPLVFLFWEGAGFVYVTGNGVVTLKEGERVTLPIPE